MKGTIDAYIQTWYMGYIGVEIIAAGTLSNSNLGTHHWRKHSSLISNATRNVTATTKTHLELIHLDSCHFYPLVSVDPTDNSAPVIVVRHHKGSFVLSEFCSLSKLSTITGLDWITGLPLKSRACHYTNTCDIRITQIRSLRVSK